jgi:site-specific DNA-methyltransferase (adenine-specific)
MVTILQGDAIEQLRTLPDCSVHMCVTSPPYFGLRDYGVDGQIGLEDTPGAYVARLVDVFREVRRVLRDDGTLWLNLGDSYTNKQLTGIPWRVAFALQADGWYLRQDIIWHKPNPTPESVTDRCTKAHEYVFLLSKSARYYYDHDAVKEPSKEPNKFNGSRGRQTKKTGANGNRNDGGRGAIKGDGTRNRRSVWTVTTRPYQGAHFATFPPKLIEPCILAGTSERGVCPHCGDPWQRLVHRPKAPNEVFTNTKSIDPARNRTMGGGLKQTGEKLTRWRAENPSVTTGWTPTCKCPEHEPVSAAVLDPFGGSGTTAVVAQQHGRHAILIELNPAYIALAEERIGKVLV